MLNRTPIALSGYQITEQLYAGSRTLVYRAIREADQQPVVLKLLKNEHPSFNELVQFRNQYTIVKNLSFPGIIQFYCLEPYPNGYILVMEDFGGISLHEYVRSKRDESLASPSFPQPEAATQAANPTLSNFEFLTIALQLCDILHQLCRTRVIHRDLKPANILIHPISQKVKLIDFSIASLLPRETQEIKNPNVLEGTLAYLSPEQTGRMNRGIDYRSDFYSLGVTFYELLTGRLPCQSGDPMELVHCHITQQPPSIHSLNPQVPPILSEIVAKLMAKNAEDRYQSALGLKRDLEVCFKQWQEQGTLSEFTLGQHDRCDRFLIPETLYGRAEEVQALLDAFARVATPQENRAETAEMLLVAGFSGIGKTAVVNEVHKPIVQQRGYFIKGKFDQFQRNIPFSAFVQALRDLMGQLLSESDAQLASWKSKILKAVGENGQAILEVIPELEQMIGQQPPVPELSGSAAQNRFNLLLQKFIQVFTTADHPLVLFLDDLQWADSASLNLIKWLMNESAIGYLLILGSYRDNEVFLAHPLMLTLAEIEQAKATLNTIRLSALSPAHINQLVADTLSCAVELARPLSELVDQKTQGNPFFITQFLKSLHDDRRITFDFNLGHWQCDIAQVRSLALTDDVVEFMALQLHKLPVETQDMLKLAACIGAQFDLQTLAIVSQRSPETTAADLWRALQEGLILPINQVYKFYQEADIRLTAQNAALTPQNCVYKFLHDRVQQAAYSLIPESQKQTTHREIGRLLLREVPQEKREAQLFEIANQLNWGIDRVSTIEEQLELAQLNLLAGRKAKDSTAYAAALKYFTQGRSQLDPQSWQTHYDLTLALHIYATEAAYLSKDFDQMEELADIVIKHAKTLLDSLRIYQIKIQADQARNNLSKGIATSLNLLVSLNIPLPQHPSRLNLWRKRTQIQWALMGKKVSDLIDLPTTQDPYTTAAIQILATVESIAVFANPPLWQLVVLQLLELSLKQGNTATSAIGYSSYAIILCRQSSRIELGYQFGQLALAVLARCPHHPEVKATVLFKVNVAIRHWKEHWRDTLQPLLESYQTALEVGQFDYSANAARIYCVRSYFVGKELPDLSHEMAIYLEAMTQLKQARALTWHRIYWQAIANLMHQTSVPGRLVGEYFNQDETPLSSFADDRMAAFTLCCNQLILNYLFADYQAAQVQAEAAEQYLSRSLMSIDLILFDFYDCLNRLKLSSALPQSQRKNFLSKVCEFQEQLRQWSVLGPMNFQHKLDLIAAEQARVNHQFLEALELYDRAIAGAKEYQYLQEEALANELAAQFYLDWGKEKIARVYMQEAYYCYVRWGAKAKVDDLEQRYPRLLTSIDSQPQPSLSPAEAVLAASTQANQTTTIDNPSSSTFPNVSAFLDLATLFKASQSLSSQINLEKLLSTLLHVVVENAGADKCVLLMPQSDHWVIEAMSELGQADSILQSLPIEAGLTVPLALINQVKHTLQPLVIGNTIEYPMLAVDPYMLQKQMLRKQPQSMLCTPILNQGKLIGILYLENNLTSRAFTSDRIELLNLICVQAAISLENARLYADEQEKTKVLQRVAKDLKRFKTRLTFLIESTPLGVIEWNPNFEVVGWNPAAEKIFGYQAVEMLNNHALEIVPAAYQAYVIEVMTDLMQQKGGTHSINENITKDGGVIICEWINTPLLDEQGNSMGIYSMVQDITERKRIEAERQQKSEALEKALRDLQQTQIQLIQGEKMSALGNLVAGVAHEINNPVGFLGGNIAPALDYIKDLFGLVDLYQQKYPQPRAISF